MIISYWLLCLSHKFLVNTQFCPEQLSPKKISPVDSVPKNSVPSNSVQKLRSAIAAIMISNKNLQLDMISNYDQQLQLKNACLYQECF